MGTPTATWATSWSIRGSVLMSEWYPIVEYGQAHRWRASPVPESTLVPDAWGNHRRPAGARAGTRVGPLGVRAGAPRPARRGSPAPPVAQSRATARTPWWSIRLSGWSTSSTCPALPGPKTSSILRWLPRRCGLVLAAVPGGDQPGQLQPVEVGVAEGVDHRSRSRCSRISLPQGGDLVAVPRRRGRGRWSAGCSGRRSGRRPTGGSQDDDVLVVLVVVGEYDGGARSVDGGAAAWGVPGPVGERHRLAAEQLVAVRAQPDRAGRTEDRPGPDQPGTGSQVLRRRARRAVGTRSSCRWPQQRDPAAGPLLERDDVGLQVEQSAEDRVRDPAAGAFTQTFWVSRGPPAGSCPWQPLHAPRGRSCPQAAEVVDLGLRDLAAPRRRRRAAPPPRRARGSPPASASRAQGHPGRRRRRWHRRFALVLERHRREPGARCGRRRCSRARCAHGSPSKSACCAFAADDSRPWAASRDAEVHALAPRRRAGSGPKPLRTRRARGPPGPCAWRPTTPRSTTPPPSWVPARRGDARRRCSCPGSRSARSPAAAPSPAGTAWGLAVHRVARGSSLVRTHRSPSFLLERMTSRTTMPRGSSGRHSLGATSGSGLLAPAGVPTVGRRDPRRPGRAPSGPRCATGGVPRGRRSGQQAYHEVGDALPRPHLTPSFKTLLRPVLTGEHSIPDRGARRLGRRRCASSGIGPRSGRSGTPHSRSSIAGTGTWPLMSRRPADPHLIVTGAWWDHVDELDLERVGPFCLPTRRVAADAGVGDRPRPVDPPAVDHQPVDVRRGPTWSC